MQLTCYAVAMRGASLSELNCSVARTLDVVGERWTLLILRDAFNGIRRFDHFLETMPIARNVLAARLRKLVGHGVLERTEYQERPRRFEYRLTPAGRELYPAIISLLQWGDRHLAGAEGPPMKVLHKDCGGHPKARVVCAECGETVDPRASEPVYPGGKPGKAPTGQPRDGD